MTALKILTLEPADDSTYSIALIKKSTSAAYLSIQQGCVGIAIEDESCLNYSRKASKTLESFD
jgi:hypothetical protein